jgi:hypothetical protein
MVGVLHDELSDKFVESEDEEHESGEEIHPESGGDASSHGGSAEASEADGEELGEDSTDNNGLETIVRGHGDGDDLGLIAHLSSNEHQGE